MKYLLNFRLCHLFRNRLYEFLHSSTFYFLHSSTFNSNILSVYKLSILYKHRDFNMYNIFHVHYTFTQLFSILHVRMSATRKAAPGIRNGWKFYNSRIQKHSNPRKLSIASFITLINLVLSDFST